MRGRGEDNEQQLEIRSDECTNSITTVQKDNLVLVRQATKEGTIPCEVGGVCDLNYPDSKTRRGRVQGNGQICPTLTTENIPNVLEEWTWEINGEIYLIRIRKLTPRECWRLMGFTDEDFDKAQEVNSNTQLYKQAGNSIVVPVLEGIFRQLMEG
jgi:DNA (cytosine-5)-methyltransferase 1